MSASTLIVVSPRLDSSSRIFACACRMSASMRSNCSLRVASARARFARSAARSASVVNPSNDRRADRDNPDAKSPRPTALRNASAYERPASPPERTHCRSTSSPTRSAGRRSARRSRGPTSRTFSSTSTSTEPRNPGPVTPQSPLCAPPRTLNSTDRFRNPAKPARELPLAGHQRRLLRHGLHERGPVLTCGGPKLLLRVPVRASRQRPQQLGFDLVAFLRIRRHDPRERHVQRAVNRHGHQIHPTQQQMPVEFIPVRRNPADQADCDSVGRPVTVSIAYSVNWPRSSEVIFPAASSFFNVAYVSAVNNTRSISDDARATSLPSLASSAAMNSPDSTDRASGADGLMCSVTSSFAESFTLNGMGFFRPRCLFAAISNVFTTSPSISDSSPSPTGPLCAGTGAVSYPGHCVRSASRHGGPATPTHEPCAV
ncbi:hypothetical protein PIS_008 [Saccharomonospora phage PIS 136]|nr:hypothetical protein PIS_008 [Saccharomonospora phage PIS 136]